jgi:hypothetical protein
VSQSDKPSLISCISPILCTPGIPFIPGSEGFSCRAERQRGAERESGGEGVSVSHKPSSVPGTANGGGGERQRMAVLGGRTLDSGSEIESRRTNHREGEGGFCHSRWRGREMSKESMSIHRSLRHTFNVPPPDQSPRLNPSRSENLNRCEVRASDHHPTVLPTVSKLEGQIIVAGHLPSDQLRAGICAAHRIRKHPPPVPDRRGSTLELGDSPPGRDILPDPYLANFTDGKILH